MRYTAKTVEEYKALLGKRNYKMNYAGYGTGDIDAINRVDALENPDTLRGGYIYTHGILYRLFPSFNMWGRKEFTPTDEGTLENVYEWIKEYCQPKIVWMSKDATYYKNLATLIDYPHSTLSGQRGYKELSDFLEELWKLGCQWFDQIDLEDRGEYEGHRKLEEEEIAMAKAHAKEQLDNRNYPDKQSPYSNSQRSQNLGGVHNSDK